MSAIPPIDSPGRVAIPRLDDSNRAAGPGGPSFAEALRAAAAPVAEAQSTADAELGKLMRGDAVDLHGLMIAGEKAQLSLQLMMQIRNKLIDAYREIMQMPV